MKRYHHLIPKETMKVPLIDYARDEGDEKLEVADGRLYQELLGSFNWLATLTMPDIASASAS